MRRVWEMQLSVPGAAGRSVVTASSEIGPGGDDGMRMIATAAANQYLEPGHVARARLV
jgi:hypothetical protein